MENIMSINFCFQTIAHAPKYIVDSSPWRYTVGRASCAAKAPLYLIGSFLQLGKLLSKNCIYCFGWLTSLGTEDATRCLSEEGITRDGCAYIDLGDSASQNFEYTFLAPPPGYDSLLTTISSIFKTVFLGSYHINGDGPSATPFGYE
jgi:hypothetical protein